MVNYKNGKIYKLTGGGLTYIGSTTQRLSKRKSQHKCPSNPCTSKLITEYDDYDIVLIENYPCNSREELHARERHYIESMECINKTVPTRTPREYYVQHIERKKSYGKTYYERNKDILKMKDKLYREQNKEKIKRKGEVYREKNKEKLKKYYEENKEKYKLYYEKNKERIKIMDKEYYDRNTESILARGREYYKKNKEKIIAQKTAYRKKNKDYINAQRRARYLKKKQEKSNIETVE